jgi:hypothetical protein
MNDADTQITETGTPVTEPDPQVTRTPAHGTSARGSFAEGEELLPEKNAAERVLHPGSFASGEEEMPKENADRRVHARGGFAVGEETTPEKDAEERGVPGTFADSEPAV